MQKFLLDMAHADDRCRAHHAPASADRAPVVVAGD
jgi:hypothetical protein